MKLSDNIALFAVLAMPAQIIAQGEQEHERGRFPHYRVKDLGTLGGTFSQAFGINDRSHVGGGASLPNGNLHAFLWTKHTGMRDLGTLGGPNNAASGPNDRDEVPIVSDTSTPDPFGEDFALSAPTFMPRGDLEKRRDNAASHPGRQ